jgi:hypothetical protein
MSSTTAAVATAPDPRAAAIIDYDSHTFDEYAAKWDVPLGPGGGAGTDVRMVAQNRAFSIAPVPFQTRADAIDDHPKYFAVSHDLFAMPQIGSLQFSVDIKTSSRRTQPGRAIHESYADNPHESRPYAQFTIEGQQAVLMFDMTNVETGKVFDWFVSGSSVFALIERLPSRKNPTRSATDPGYVGRDSAYTEIIGSSRTDTSTICMRSSVEYFLDGDLFARVDHVGIPRDTQGAAYTGVYPSHDRAPGEELKDRMNTFAIGHGLHNVLDAFPFGHPDPPDEAGSILMAKHLFGRGPQARFAQGQFSKFEVITTSD